jgi:hypothetical protein
VSEFPAAGSGLAAGKKGGRRNPEHRNAIVHRMPFLRPRREGQDEGQTGASRSPELAPRLTVKTVQLKPIKPNRNARAPHKPCHKQGRRSARHTRISPPDSCPWLRSKRDKMRQIPKPKRLTCCGPATYDATLASRLIFNPFGQSKVENGAGPRHILLSSIHGFLRDTESENEYKMSTF